MRYCIRWIFYALPGEGFYGEEAFLSCVCPGFIVSDSFVCVCVAWMEN